MTDLDKILAEHAAYKARPAVWTITLRRNGDVVASSHRGTFALGTWSRHPKGGWVYHWNGDSRFFGHRYPLEQAIKSVADNL